MAELKHTEESSVTDIREKLVELLDTNCGYVDEVKAEVLADHLLANGVTIQAWIPVSERLPCGYIVVDPSTNYKELEQYLVFCKDALFPTTAYFVDGKFVSLCETGCPSGERWCGIGEVTHWMSLSALPTPPKGE